MVWAGKCAWVLALWLGLAMLHGVGAQMGAPSPSVDCASAITGLIDCLSFVQKGSNMTKPQGHCCSALKKVVKEEVACLCQVFNESSNFATLNVTKALTLPSACGITTSPFSNCHSAVLGPTPAPSPSSGAAPAPGSPSGARALSAPSFVVVLAAVAVALRFYDI